MRTIAAAVACVQNGNGDQVLIAEGTTYGERLPTLWGKAGNSLLYPTVIESYDPTDALNEAKYGRATSGRPVITGNNAGQNFIMGVKGQGYVAVRGLDINPGNNSGQAISMVDVGDGILIENNILRYTGLQFTIFTSPQAHHWIVRGNAIYGSYTTDGGTSTVHGLYADGTDTLTVEDNVFWHNAWKIGASRDDPDNGPTMFGHPIYQQTSTDAVVRRNLIADGAADGGSYRGNATVTENVLIDDPIAIGAGGGTIYNTDRPNGVNLQVAYNAILGSADLNSTSPRQWGISSENGAQGSSFHNNLIARAANPGGNPTYATDAPYPQPSYMDYHDNVSYLWSLPGQVSNIGPHNVSNVFATFENNVWDGPASGSNSNIASHSLPNPYTIDQLSAALGFSGKQAWIDYAINHPETHPARNARSLLFAGYGLN